MTRRPDSEQALGRFTLAFCNNTYVAPPASYLSYAANDTMQTLDLLEKNWVNAEIILGAADKTLAADWPGKIQSRGIPVTVIDNTGHFFDGSQEFDLADKVENLLKTLPAGNRRVSR